MKLTLIIESENELMDHPADAARALRDVATRLDVVYKTTLEKGPVEGVIRDDNGNSVGSWVITN